jgi:hypothetical protein
LTSEKEGRIGTGGVADWIAGVSATLSALFSVRELLQAVNKESATNDKIRYFMNLFFIPCNINKTVKTGCDKYH